MRFQGKVALVTGGARGIGRATSELLAAEGACVAIMDLDLGPGQAVADRFGEGGLAIACDVTRREEVEAAVARVVETFGSLDVLVCCAGIIRDNLVHKMSDADWDRVIDTHLKGSFLCCQAAQRVMVARRRGRIVLLSSTSARGNRGQVNYATAKAGLQGMAATLAIELGPFGVTVNAVAPGFVETRMTEATAQRQGIEFDEFKRRAAAGVPLRRIAQPSDIANVIAFLCSDDAAYVSGQTIYVKGGP